ncbi:MAG: helix-turn-helix domain-containing protein, partial [Acidimicrobiales bacterium]
MPDPEESPEKTSLLRHCHALNPRPERVRDLAFAGGNPFFDANDLVQVKYEMLRRVSEDGRPVSEVSATFGFSRPSYYEAQHAFAASGLVGLVPQRPGPRRAHKLSAEVVSALEAAKSEDPGLNSAALARLV